MVKSKEILNIEESHEWEKENLNSLLIEFKNKFFYLNVAKLILENFEEKKIHFPK